MSMGPLGIVGSIAGSPLAQTKGSEVDRAAQSAADQARQVTAERQAEQAAGIGQTEEDQQSSERDADGRRLWEQVAESSGDSAEEDAAEAFSPPQSKDPSGDRGQRLDLSG